jgi:DnaJ-class molecular chaperone
MTHVEKCPVCEGRGTVPHGFYDTTNGEWISTSIVPEKCRSCDGRGYVVVNGSGNIYWSSNTEIKDKENI